MLLGFGDKAILTMDEALPGLLSVVCLSFSASECAVAYRLELRLMEQRERRLPDTLCSMMDRICLGKSYGSFLSNLLRERGEYFV